MDVIDKESEDLGWVWKIKNIKFIMSVIDKEMYHGCARRCGGRQNSDLMIII